MTDAADQDPDPESLEAAQPSRPARIAVENLRRRPCLSKPTQGFPYRGVESLLIKGASIARWLYEDPGARAYIDFDLLLRPGDEPAAAEVLASLGYAPAFDDRAMPEMVGRARHRLVLGAGGRYGGRAQDRAGGARGPATVWSVLSRGTEELEVGGFRADVLSLPARALHVALHAAQHGPDDKVLLDLERLCRGSTTLPGGRRWSLAGELEAIDAMAAGLRLDPAAPPVA